MKRSVTEEEIEIINTALELKVIQVRDIAQSLYFCIKKEPIQKTCREEHIVKAMELIDDKLITREWGIEKLNEKIHKWKRS